jgi:hypothetical protein
MKTQEARWLYGPGVVACLDEWELTARAEKMSARARMAIHRWRSGGKVDYYALDRMLTELTAVAFPNTCASALLDELPDELFCEQPDYRRKEISVES